MFLCEIRIFQEWYNQVYKSIRRRELLPFVYVPAGFFYFFIMSAATFRATKAAGLQFPSRKRKRTGATSTVMVPVATMRPTAPIATRGFGPFTGRRKFERKFSDSNGVVGTTVNTTGLMVLLHNPALGSDYNQRIGRKTMPKSIYIRGRIGPIALNITPVTNPTDQGYQQARMIIFADFQPNGATPAITDLLVNADPASQLNPNNRDRFRVLKEKTWTFDAVQINPGNQGFGTINRTVAQLKVFKRLRNFETIFNGTNGGTIADINSGALYVCWIGSAAGATASCAANWSYRVRYEDA